MKFGNMKIKLLIQSGVYNSQHFVQKLELVNMIEVVNLVDKVYCRLKDD